MKKHLTVGITSLIATSLASSVYADLTQMNDQQLSDSTAAGLGLALENFVLNSDSAVLKVTGINDSLGNEVAVNWSELYIMGEGSEEGSISTPTDIGSYLHPWVFRSVRGTADWDGDPATHHSGEYAAIGDDIALMEFTTGRFNSATQNTKQYVEACIMANDPACSTMTPLRRKGMDIGSKFEFLLPGGPEYLDVDIKGAYVDGSQFRLWSRADDSASSELFAQLRVNFFAKEIDIGVCDSGCNANLSTLNLDNVYLDINLGYGEIQPLTFDVTSNGHFELELAKPNPGPQGVDSNNSAAMLAFYDDFYANAPKSNVYIGNIQVGNNTAGEAIVRDMSIQYMKITSQDL